MGAPQLHIAMDAARRALTVADGVGLVDHDELVESHEALAHVLRQLLDALAADRPARLSVQHDAEFRNLCRAARTEIYVARGALQRLDRFERALTSIVWPDEVAEGGDGRD